MDTTKLVVRTCEAASQHGDMIIIDMPCDVLLY
jgi:hypothetical protein